MENVWRWQQHRKGASVHAEESESVDESYWDVIIITIIVFRMFMREVHWNSMDRWTRSSVCVGNGNTFWIYHTYAVCGGARVFNWIWAHLNLNLIHEIYSHSCTRLVTQNVYFHAVWTDFLRDLRIFGALEWKRNQRSDNSKIFWLKLQMKWKAREKVWEKCSTLSPLMMKNVSTNAKVNKKISYFNPFIISSNTFFLSSCLLETLESEISQSKRRQHKKIFITPREIAQKQRKFHLQFFFLPVLYLQFNLEVLQRIDFDIFKQEISSSQKIETEIQFEIFMKQSDISRNYTAFSWWKMCWWRLLKNFKKN